MSTEERPPQLLREFFDYLAALAETRRGPVAFLPPDPAPPAPASPTEADADPHPRGKLTNRKIAEAGKQPGQQDLGPFPTPKP